MARIRTSRSGRQEGLGEYQGHSVYRSDISENSQLDTVTDEFGVRNGFFGVDHVYSTGAMTGRWPPTGVPFRQYTAWVPSYFRNPAVNSVPHLNVPGLPSFSDTAVRVLSATNPSKASVDLPVAIAELRELPDLVRKFGRGILRQIADGNLRYQFGVKPMVSDFCKLLDFKKSVDKQVQILQGFGKGPQVRKATVFTGSVVQEPGTILVVHSAPSELQMSCRLVSHTTTVQRWGYVTWTPTVPDFRQAFLGDPASAYALARKIALGLTLDASTAWELLPWSWLVDWFSNMGEYIDSHRSLIPVAPDTPAVCTTTKSVQFYSNTNNAAGIPWDTFHFTRVRTTKQRMRASALFPSASLPLLTGRQTGILSSLAVLRSR